MSCMRISTTTDSDPPLISTPPPPTDSRIKRALRCLACSSPASSDASAPASAARSSADWQGKRSRRRRLKQKNSKRESRHHHQSVVPSSAAAAAAASDVVWCGPAFADDSVDCVVRHHAMMMMGGRGGRHDADGIHREIMMFQTRMMSGRMNVYDRYRDLRLDVDRMSYEELLELGDKIGYVNTGLREEEISCSLRKMKHSVLDASSLYISTEMEKKCSICQVVKFYTKPTHHKSLNAILPIIFQEEYEVNDEMGKLGCGHSYHMYCIKQWLLQKNACPVCKTAVTKT